VHANESRCEEQKAFISIAGGVPQLLPGDRRRVRVREHVRRPPANCYTIPVRVTGSISQDAAAELAAVCCHMSSMTHACVAHCHY
jgi:hypothetical protein